MDPTMFTSTAKPTWEKRPHRVYDSQRTTAVLGLFYIDHIKRFIKSPTCPNIGLGLNHWFILDECFQHCKKKTQQCSFNWWGLRHSDTGLGVYSDFTYQVKRREPAGKNGHDSSYAELDREININYNAFHLFVFRKICEKLFISMNYVTQMLFCGIRCRHPFTKSFFHQII